MLNQIKPRTFDIDYQEPTTLAEAQERLKTLGGDYASICDQLGDRDRKIDGRRMTDEEYWQWRKKAIAAKSWKQEEMRRIKAWMREHFPFGTNVGKKALMPLCARALAALLDHLGLEPELVQEIQERLDQNLD